MTVDELELELDVRVVELDGCDIEEELEMEDEALL